MLVLDGTILDSAERIIEVLRDRTWLLTEVVALACIQVINVADRTDYGSSTASTSLLESIQLILRNLTALHLQTEILSQLHQTLVGDRREDRCTLRSNVCIILDSEEVGSTTLIHVFLLLGVEIELACITLLVSDIVGSERSSIVATNLIDTCSERSRAVEITDDDVWVGYDLKRFYKGKNV
mgnify:CR=1 FL=1